MIQVFLIRHPPTLDTAGLCYGRLNVRVSEPAVAGIVTAALREIPRQALMNAQVHCSPLSRCAELARKIAAPRCPISAEDLFEMDFGSWEGVRWSQVARIEIDAWASDPWSYRPGGGESAQMVALRWRRWIESLRQSETRVVIAVTHAGLVRVALAQTETLSVPRALQASIPFGSVHRFDID
jgi:alpha-ribazole phosphatase